MPPNAVSMREVLTAFASSSRLNVELVHKHVSTTSLDDLDGVQSDRHVGRDEQRLTALVVNAALARIHRLPEVTVRVNVH